MKDLIRKILTFWYGSVVYRKHDYDETCCCGSEIVTHSHEDGKSYTSCRDRECPGRCQKEYAVTSAVNEKMRHWN